MMNDEHSTVSQRLSELIAPLETLTPGQTAGAIRVARELGRELGEEFRRCVLCLIHGGRRVLVDARAYLTWLVAPWWEECGFGAEDLWRWEAAFTHGHAAADPRVQAFTAAITETALRIADEVDRKRRVLARYIETSPDEITLRGAGPGAQMVYGHRSRRFLVLTPAEEAALGSTAHLDGCGPARHPARGGDASQALVPQRFLDHAIVPLRP